MNEITNAERVNQILDILIKDRTIAPETMELVIRCRENENYLVGLLVIVSELCRLHPPVLQNLILYTLLEKK